MKDWTAGYVADIGYTYGYYSELNPARLNFALLNAGLACPEIKNACELGFGQGLSVNLHAAASSTTWYGTDFNPSQASFAQELAQASGARSNLFDEAFEQFCARTDLPEFEYIGLHGIWSWISDANRQAIVDFIARKLKVGGVLYISYNTLPGWAQMVPMRHLLTEHAEVMAAPGRGIVSRIDAALEFTEKLMETSPMFARANPPVVERLKKIQEQNRHYLAHEYFNKDWEPMHFADMAAWLEPAKLTFGCSAHYLDHVEAINLSTEQLNFLNEIPDLDFRQTVRDFMVNQQFRRDYWVRGPRRMTPLDQAEALRKQRVVLVTPESEVSLKAQGSLGEATMQEAVYKPILQALSDQKPHSLESIEETLKKNGHKDILFAQVIQACLILIGKGDLSPAVTDEASNAAKKFTDRANQFLMSKARSSAEISYLASPVTGGGVAIGRFQQIFLSSLLAGKKNSDDWALDAWNTLKIQGQRIIKEGQTLESEEANVQELKAQAKEFSGTRLAMLKALKLV
jgi:SAM-dependent methyltransferase